MISGTGTITMGWNNGKCHRVAGWGPLLGDEGSGFDLGLRALRAVASAAVCIITLIYVRLTVYAGPRS